MPGGAWSLSQGLSVTWARGLLETNHSTEAFGQRRAMGVEALPTCPPHLAKTWETRLPCPMSLSGLPHSPLGLLLGSQGPAAHQPCHSRGPTHTAGPASSFPEQGWGCGPERRGIRPFTASKLLPHGPCIACSQMTQGWPCPHRAHHPAGG